MAHDWLSNPDAVNHIKHVLHTSGVPLETQVARICDQTERWLPLAGAESTSFTAGRLLYGESPMETALREVDQGLMTQGFLQLGDTLDLSVELHILIECKHRDELAVFGFPAHSRRPPPLTPPMLCDFAFAKVLHTITDTMTLFVPDRLGTLALLSNMDKKPRVAEEQLIYKAGGSLYDCIRFHTVGLTEPAMDPLIAQLGLVERFHATNPEPLFDWWTTVRAWMHAHLTEDDYAAFAQAYTADLPAHIPTLAVFLPLVCVDAPLYTVTTDDQGAIDTFVPQSYLLTTLRVPHWPGHLQPYLVQAMPEALITVVDVTALDAFLADVAQWWHTLATALRQIDEQVALRFLCQKAVLQSIVSTRPNPHRSAWVWRV